jgi:hypothetical protein
MFFIDGLFAAKIVFISILPSGTSANEKWFSEFVMQLSEKYAVRCSARNATAERVGNKLPKSRFTTKKGGKLTTFFIEKMR